MADMQTSPTTPPYGLHSSNSYPFPAAGGSPTFSDHRRSFDAYAEGQQSYAYPSSYAARSHHHHEVEATNSRTLPAYLRHHSTNFSGIPNPVTEDKANKRRRGNLPKPVTDILRAWFHEHLDHPYPSEEDKQMFMSRTGLSISQVSLLLLLLLLLLLTG